MKEFCLVSILSFKSIPRVRDRDNDSQALEVECAYL